MARVAKNNVPKEGEKTPDYAVIGEMLKDTRESYGVSLEQAAAALHMRAAFLASIEKGRLDDVPGGAVYAKGHLRMYAQYLGINLATMLSLLSTESVVKPVASHSSSLNEPKRTRHAALLSVVAMAVAGILWYAYFQPQPMKDVSLVKPLPQQLDAYLMDRNAGGMGLDSPCVRDAFALAWPSCYAAADEALMRRLEERKYQTILQVK